MSTATLVLAPHGDDETLWASYICMRTRAHVIVCSVDADPRVRFRRNMETASACRLMGCSYHVWPMPANEFDLEQGKVWLASWNSTQLVASTPERVFAPAIEEHGHEQHNAVGQLALDVFGPELVSHYLTYAPRGVRSRGGKEVRPSMQEVHTKLKALACYETQILNPATSQWFFELLDLREWVA